VFKGYSDPEAQTPKFVITKKIKLAIIEDEKTLFKLNLLNEKYPIAAIIQKLEYCHKAPG
jgi:hypothetical protein|tara:strand:+ start:282 stop:461 length:180 start_codon:yes stop_codon:yes gene_type:complete